MNIFYNFIITLKRYTASAVLNIIGLSLAFAAFMVLVIQTGYEYSYNSYNRNADRTYRVSLVEKADVSKEKAVFSQSIIDRLSTASPHIIAATMLDNLIFNKNLTLTIERSNGAVESFQADFSQVYAAFIKVADIEIVEGDAKALNQPFNAIISESMAKKLFPNESAVGQIVKCGKEMTVGAVYKDIPANADIKNAFYYTRPEDKKYPDYMWNFMFLVALDSQESLNETEAVLNQSLDEYFKNAGEENKFQLKMTSMLDMYYTANVRNDFPDKGDKTKTDIMLAIAFLIVIIATINYVNFASSMAPLKIKMMNIQRIMGAGLWKLRMSIIIESVLIALLSFFTAILLVYSLSTSSFTDVWIADITISNNIVSIFYTLALAVMIGLAAGVYPAFFMTSFTPVIALRGSFALSSKGRAFRSLLVGFQYVISTILIIAALFITLQNKFVSKYNLGYNKDEIAVVKINSKIYKNREVLSEEIKSNSEVVDMAYADSKLGSKDYYQTWGTEINNEECKFNIVPVSYNFLSMMEIPIEEGRDFRIEDKSSSAGLLIFNRVSPKEDGSPILLSQEGYEQDFKVIGFFDSSVHLQTMYVAENPFAFLFSNDFTFDYIYVKIGKGVDKIAAAENILKSIKKIDPTFSGDVEYLDNQLNELYEKDHRSSYLTLAASLLAVAITLIGVFGLLLFETQLRRKEIGVRRVLGATVNEILALFNKKYILTTLICFVIALPIAIYAVNYWLSSFQYRIPVYWWVFVIALLIVLIITSITVTLRSWKAANVNPVESLKNE